MRLDEFQIGRSNQREGGVSGSWRAETLEAGWERSAHRLNSPSGSTSALPPLISPHILAEQKPSPGPTDQFSFPYYEEVWRTRTPSPLCRPITTHYLHRCCDFQLRLQRQMKRDGNNGRRVPSVQHLYPS